MKLLSGQTVPLSELSAGAELLLRVGEAVPVNGEVIYGEATMDESKITGEVCFSAAAHCPHMLHVKKKRAKNTVPRSTGATELAATGTAGGEVCWR